MTSAVLALEGIEKRFGATVTAAGITLELARGEFFTLLGPSGSGKSTILRIVAGLEQPDAGCVRLDGADITGLPPWQRGLGMVFQQYANFPHMNVAENVGYGLRRSSVSASERDDRIGELLKLVGLAGFEHRVVTQLSGGEQQRVAIARALAPHPEILLLDEPLSALDEKIRREMQDELRRIQQTTGTTFVYVTHDQEEALTMSDRIAVLNQGQCVQCDAPQTVFRCPRTRFVAQFFRGCNVLDAETTDGGGQTGIRLAGTRVELPCTVPGVDRGLAVAIRGENVHVGPASRDCDLIVEGVLEEAVYRGLYTEYRFRMEDGQALSAMTGLRLDAHPGERVPIGINADDIIALEDR